jgi:tetratricopeptide (TPR) repeat protein
MRQENLTRLQLQRRRADQHLDRAERFERAGRLDEAMAEFKSAVELDPDIPDAQAALGFHYRRKGLLTKALDAFQRAANLAADYDSFYSLGHVLTDLGRYAEAIHSFERCLVLRPADPAALYELAYVHFSAKRYEQALSILTGIISLENGGDDWELLYLRASCSLHLGAYAAAQEDIERALAAAPDGDPHALLMETLDIARRYREFANQDTFSAKDRLYAEYGAIILGSAQDDGVRIPEYEQYDLDYGDVAMTASRFAALYHTLDRHASAILPADAQALPLAIVLGELLRLPVVCLEEATKAGEDAACPLLVVLGVCSSPELSDLLLEQLPEKTICFALALDWSGRSEFMTDIVGVYARQPATLPWECDLDWNTWGLTGVDLRVLLRLTSFGKAVQGIVDRLTRAIEALPPSHTGQIDYYTRDHTHLRATLSLSENG